MCGTFFVMTVLYVNIPTMQSAGFKLLLVFDHHIFLAFTCQYNYGSIDGYSLKESKSWRSEWELYKGKNNSGPCWQVVSSQTGKLGCELLKWHDGSSDGMLKVWKARTNKSSGHVWCPHIPKCVLDNLLEEGFTIKKMSTVLSVSESTIYLRMNRYGLSKFEFTDISDEEVDGEIDKVTKEYPYCGENLIKQILFHNGVKVQWMRIRDSTHRVDHDGVSPRKKGQLHRRVYNVRGPIASGI